MTFGLVMGAVQASSVLLGSACASKASAVQAGGECFIATDCAPGLICIEQPNKARICSDDLSRVAGRVPAEAGADEDDAGVVVEDAAPDAPPVTPPIDSGVRDTGVPLPDTGPPPPDTGPPPVDSGTAD